MNVRSLAHYRHVVLYLAVSVFGLAVAVLVLDHIRWLMLEPREREALAQAEDAARDDPGANAALEQLTVRQTNESLRLKQRERIAGIAALVAAGIAVALLKPQSIKQPFLPDTLAAQLAGRRGAATDAVPAGAIEGDHGSNGHAKCPRAVDVTKVEAIVARVGAEQHRLIPLLHAIQAEYNYLPAEALAELCRLTQVTPAQVAGVASFYTRFRTRPRGKHLLQVCRGTACHVAGADRVLEELRRHLGIAADDDTDSDMNATVETVGCLGCCTLAPVVQCDEAVHEHVAVEDLPELVATCRADNHHEPARYQPAKRRRTSLAQAAGEGWSARLYRRFVQRASDHQPARIPTAPLLKPNGATTQLSDALAVVTGSWSSDHFVTLDEYQHGGGFAALAKCLDSNDPASVIEQVQQSGLRGRGGGGFPTASKWRMVRQAAGEKYVVCNGDEGDPGAFMDRSIMETSPACVLEGLLIAAWAVGANHAVVYVRHEYPVAVKRIRGMVDELVQSNLAGENILNSGYSCDIEVIEGGGAFVCGEETALIESVMGHRGTPHSRPPYPAEVGLWGRPTLVNNVETLASVPWIVRHGGSRFAAVGTVASKGSKVFSLAGKVRHGGLVEVPMGTTIRQLVDNYGGGMAAGRQFKAVQIGGPSGGCLPAELADTPIDYDALRELGAIMGSGGLVVLDDTDCMVDVARYFLEFTQQESCGHCTFCRVGTRKLLDILERICAGKGKPRDLADIETLANSITLGSLCGLGKTAPNPVLTTLRYFRDEYVAHLEGRCPAGRCKSLIDYKVTSDCVGCTLCAQHCPVAAIDATPYRQHWIDSAVCTRCDACRTTCPEEAIVIVSNGRTKAAIPSQQVA